MDVTGTVPRISNTVTVRRRKKKRVSVREQEKEETGRDTKRVGRKVGRNHLLQVVGAEMGK